MFDGALGRAEAPFGGVKGSGFSSEGGTEIVDGYFVTEYIA